MHTYIISTERSEASDIIENKKKRQKISLEQLVMSMYDQTRELRCFDLFFQNNIINCVFLVDNGGC